MRHEDLLARYSASLPDGCRQSYTAIARAFLEWAGSRPLWDDVPGPAGVERVASAELVRKYENYLRSNTKNHSPYSSGTIRKIWAIVRRLYIVNKCEWPFRRGDAPIVPELEVQHSAMVPDEIEKMIDVALGRVESIELNPRPQHVAYLVLATVWGLRRIEMQEITPDRIDTRVRDGYGTIYIETAKHGRQRYHLLPPFLIKPLQDYGFKRKRTTDYVSNVFTELKIMCGFTGDESYGVGWHSIRRAAVQALKDAGVEATDRSQFFRWKTSSRDMDERYATAPTVRMGKGSSGITASVGDEDRSLDLGVYAVHPFLKMWRERLTNA